LTASAPSQAVAVANVKSFLNLAQAFPEDTEPDNAKVVYLKSSGGALINALSQSDAEITRVNIFRKPVVVGEDSYPSVTSDPLKANIWFLVSSQGGRDSQVVAGEYHYFPVNYEGLNLSNNNSPSCV
jgi:hypothetical protein